MLRIATGAADHADGETLVGAHGKRQVLSRESLVGDLPRPTRVLASVAGVNDEVPVILIVLVPTGHDDGIWAVLLATRDTGYEWLMDARGCRVRAARECGADRYAGNMTKEP